MSMVKYCNIKERIYSSGNEEFPNLDRRSTGEISTDEKKKLFIKQRQKAREELSR